MARVKLSDHFTYKRLFRFVIPSIIMMVFVSVYGIVDGFFVSRFVGEMQFAALNLIFPFIMILGAVGFMLGTGGNAVVSKALGEKDEEKANRIFSMLIYASIVIGVVLAVIGIALARPIATLFASGEKDLSLVERQELIDYCTVYARVILITLPAFMLQNAFQGFFVTAEKARLGLYVTIIAGLGNVVFDALFVAVFEWGLVGAAIATAVNQFIGGLIPIIYFARKNDSLLRLGKTRFDGKVFAKVCYNGMSEFFTNICLSAVAIIYNAQLMSIVGIMGVSAYGVMQYIGFIFIAVFLGYAVGSAPIFGYHYGAQNDAELKNVFKKSIILSALGGVVMTLIAVLFAKPLSAIFVGGDKALLTMTTGGMRLYSLCFLGAGLNIFASAFFTALSNGGVSLLISFFRTFLCQVGAVLLLPKLFGLGLNGVWLASFVAEMITLLLSIWLFIRNRKRYRYM